MIVDRWVDGLYHHLCDLYAGVLLYEVAPSVGLWLRALKVAFIAILVDSMDKTQT